MNIYDPPELQDSVEAWQQYLEELKGDKHAEERERVKRIIAQKAEQTLKA